MNFEKAKQAIKLLKESDVNYLLVTNVDQEDNAVICGNGDTRYLGAEIQALTCFWADEVAKLDLSEEDKKYMVKVIKEDCFKRGVL